MKLSKLIDSAFNSLMTANFLLRSHGVHNCPKLGFHLEKNEKVIQKTEIQDTKNFDISNKYNNIDYVKEIKTSNENPNPNIDIEVSKNDIQVSLIKSDKVTFKPKESSVPSSQLSRAYNFTTLGFTMATSALGNTIFSKFNNNDKSFKENLLSEANSERLSQTLCKMRGAALKFGQILSTFEDVVIPEPLRTSLEKARQEANAMPKKQLISTLDKNIPEWRTKYKNFNLDPFAAASIGQVHQAYLCENKVAVKIQYPGVAKSIRSDLNNIKSLFKYLNIVPKGLYIDSLVDNLGKEIEGECDYISEAKKQTKYKKLVESNFSHFKVPKVYEELSTSDILTSEFLEGVDVDEMQDASQEVRDFIGSKLLELCLYEIMIFNFMQTDPNPANFFVFTESGKLKIGLLDFGAAREYSKEFIDVYMKIIYYSTLNDRNKIIKYSEELGFLSGLENNEMLNAHANSVLAITEPFTIDLFDFGNQQITKKIYSELPTMFKHRLKSPPIEIYSLHRRLSGTYLTCIKLRSKVKSKSMFDSIYKKYLNKKT